MNLLFETLKKRCAKLKVLMIMLVVGLISSFTPLNASTYVENGGFIPENETNYLFEGTVDVVTLNNQKYIKLCHVNLACGDIKIQIATENITFLDESCYLRYLDGKLNYIKDLEYDIYSSDTIQSCNYTNDCIYYLGYIGVEEVEGFTLTKENVLENVYIIGADCVLDTEEPFYDRSGFALVEDEYQVYLYCNTDYFYPKNMIEGNVFAFDNVDGDLSDQISFGYNTLKLEGEGKNTNLIGNHRIDIDVYDRSYNQARAEIQVVIKDCLAPLVTLDTEYKVEPSPTNSSSDLIEHLVLLDNYDNPEDLDIEITHDGLLGKETSFGEYPIEIVVTDSSGNSTTQVFTYYVMDLTPPTITGPSSISVSVDEVYSEDWFKQKFEVIDDIDGKITDFSFESTYFDTPNKLGKHNFKVVVYDEYNNETYKIGVVNVVDMTEPVFYFGGIYCNYNGTDWRGLDSVIDYAGLLDTDVLNVLTDTSSLSYGVNSIKYEVNGVIHEVKVTLVENLYEDLDTTPSINQTIKKVVGDVISWFNK